MCIPLKKVKNFIIFLYKDSKTGNNILSTEKDLFTFTQIISVLFFLLYLQIICQRSKKNV